MRLEHYGLSHESVIDPRLSLSLPLTKTLTLKESIGRYHQPPTAGDIDRVFATGGSSLVPAVRARLAARFGEAKLVGGEELTSVAWGLAARARQIWS